VDQARVKAPGLFGSLAMRLEISGEPETVGLVKRASIHRRRGGFEPPNAELEECLEQTMLAVEFSLVGGDVSHSFQLAFDPPPGVPKPRPPTTEELTAFIARTATPERLEDLATEYLEANPPIAMAACDKAVTIERDGSSAYGCTMQACSLGRKDTALRYWAGVRDKLKAEGARKKADFVCGQTQIVLP
jgi:hypothetical protein